MTTTTVAIIHPAAGAACDLRGRALRDLRLSVTDRCNFRCTYCMPRERFGREHAFLPRSALLEFDEIVRIARVFVELGVRKIRLTGGEPLLRRGLPDLVARLRSLDPALDLALTTNGTLLRALAPALAAAGLTRVTVSLDSLDDDVFRVMTDSPFSVSDVLRGIAAATKAGLGPIKINTVVRRGLNDQPGPGGFLALADHFRGTGQIVRFIEYMDVGATNGWAGEEVVPAAEIVGALDDRFGLEPVDAAYPGEVAGRYRYRDGAGEVGMIGSVTRPFCGDCTRARLAADGQLYACLFAAFGTDLRGPLRSGLGDDQLESLIRKWWNGRDDRYSELRGHRSVSGPDRIEMSYVGG
ncbi:GTP 3',8-cyclase MoaA [Pseudonocardia sp.]|uniref:GTP 3',8-cyclase MoaA n=1 Tax=Pseudonocardia sp. TaxID=60912 RepID=UPI003D0E03F2